VRCSAPLGRLGLGQPAVQPLAQLVGVVVPVRSPFARDGDAGRRDTCDTGETDDLPSCAHPSRRLSRVDHLTLTLDEAVEIAGTGDVWLFRGKSPADLAIRALTNSPVNHVGMVVAIDDLPPLLWHAELGRSLPDVWTGRRQRGVQLHHLPDAVSTWNERYRQQAWVRQLTGRIERHHEDRLMEIIARFDGRAFPTAPGLIKHAATGRLRRTSSLETIYCAELVATTYQHMGLLPSHRPASWYDPGRFWSGDQLQLVSPFALSNEIGVR
jgi:hypothetical protein